jgi:hypothetical protein
MKQPAAPSVLALLFAVAVTAAAVTPPPPAGVHEAGGREQRLHQAGGHVRGERVQDGTHDHDVLQVHRTVLVRAGRRRGQQLLDGAYGDQQQRRRRPVRLYGVGRAGVRVQHLEAPQLQLCQLIDRPGSIHHVRPAVVHPD